MDKINFDPERFAPPAKRKRPTNPIYLKACEVAKITGMPAVRWLRVVKQHEWAVNRALIELREMTPRNKSAYLQWLIKKFIGEEKAK